MNKFLFKHRWKLLIVWVIIFTIFTGSQWREQKNTIRDGKQAHDALCAINARNIQRVKESTEFLQDHPNGIPGISSKVIRNGIKSDLSTIKLIKKKINC